MSSEGRNGGKGRKNAVYIASRAGWTREKRRVEKSGRAETQMEVG